ncbi:hypothetical protein EZI54_05900 [Marinobacter halodurans]|uniref:ATPase n=1 Tax=Marinobacter halodurans TaxID=2528979 RepID=A0ABY1ZSK6_9GAMM|nr:hypothetical protein [Marinobacter halodurans]TBW57981.1 hypothetical protein EZI54_05900 [Marinobacter halodurans]
MKNPTGQKIGKTGFRIGGGINHVRYDHKTRPAQIDIKCPSCGELAVAQDTTVDGYEFSSDMAPSWRSGGSFFVMCTRCFYRAKKLAYRDLTEPYYQIAGRGEVLWAWNKKHLDMLFEFLSGQSISGHPYEFYQTYVHGDWKKYRESYLKGIQMHLSST